MDSDTVTIESECWGPITCERHEWVNRRAGLSATGWLATCDMEPFASAIGNTPQEAADALVAALEGE